MSNPSHPVTGTNSPQSVPVVVIVLISAYIAAQMIADIASLKIGLVFNLAVDMGTFIYPITFTLRDLVHKRLGKKAARSLIVAAGAVNIFMAVYLYWTAQVPGDPSWDLFAEYRSIFAPAFTIVAASIVAEIVSELLDTEMYSWFVNRVTKRFQWLRVLVSNAVSVPLDTLIFTVIAFAFTSPVNILLEIFMFNYLVKMSVTLLSLPLIYIVPERNEIR